MAINAAILEVIAKLIERTGRPCRIASLGYPDMLVTEAQIAALCGPEALGRIQFRDDSDGIARWHRIDGQVARIAESLSLFQALGGELHCFDISASRGFEIVADLNYPLPPATAGQYDIVYDGGTMEHCFNVPQVITNILGLCRIGGYIIHVNPLNYFNHGFYSFHPTFYHDFYTQSGSELVSPIYALHGPVLDTKAVELPATQGFRALPERSAVLVAARKRRDYGGEWPMQSKYRANAMLRA
jgi:hypothetical protein